MAGFSFLQILAVLGTAGLLSFLVVWLIGLTAPGRRPAPQPTQPAMDTNVFLFDDAKLVDHDAGLSEPLAQITTWDQLREWLRFRFPDLPQSLRAPDQRNSRVFGSVVTGDAATLRIAQANGKTRVTLSDPVICDASFRHEAMRAQGILVDNRAVLKASPFAMWKTDAAGTVLCQNPTCQTMLGDMPGTVADLSQKLAGADQKTVLRYAVERPDNQDPLWLDVQRAEIHSGFIYYAADVTPTVTAEAAQRRFVQTLTKTFATLSTGLVVFDRDQRLALFNPALIDLTGMSAEFLSARPAMLSFFDNLRDRQVLPEPRNYASWRAQINDVIAAASDGRYEETWSLPNALTYRVTGRPHPDGAIAFLFEDITAEISLTRRFRTQIDLRQNTLDRLRDSIAVFGPDNILVFSNDAFRSLIGADPDSAFADMTTADIARICRDSFADTTFWAKISTLRTGEHFPDVLSEIRPGADGGQMQFTFRSLPGGAVLIGSEPAIVSDPARIKQVS